MTAVEQEAHAWSGEMGHITQELIRKYVERLDGPVYYVAGPPAMVEATQKLLGQAGISDDDIRAEEFSGY
jgi:NAD(P)H-flavin reductase